MDLRPLSDDALLARLSALVHDERANLGDVVEHLMEVDRRDVVLDRGYPSLYVYCVKELRYSEAAAHFRIRAARASAKHPEVLEAIRTGRLHLEAVVRLYPHLTKENRADVIARASGATKREVLQIAADLKAPTPQKRDVIRPLPPLLPSPPPPEGDLFSEAIPFPPASAPTQIVAPSRRLTFSFEADNELAILVERLRGLLRHKHPEGRLVDIFKEASRALLRELDRRTAPTKQVRAPKEIGFYKGRKVPAAIRRAVWQRDGGRCAFMAPDGRRCESRDALEFDHVLPWALGGRSDVVENIRLLCRPHNQRLARKKFGPRARARA